MSKSTHTHPRKNRQLGSRFYGLMIVFAAAALLIIFAVFFNQKVTNREKLAYALPADRALAFIEYNLDPNSSDTKELKSLVAQNLYLQGAVDYLKAIIPHADLFNQWYQGRGGVALLRDESGHQVSLAFFLQVSNHDQALAWINQLILDPKIDALLDQDYQGQKLLAFQSGQTFDLLLSGNYLVISENLDTLKVIADTVAGKHTALHDQTNYNQLTSALPDQNVVFLYLDRSKLLDTLSKNEMFLAGRLATLKLYFPFLKLFSTEAIAVKLDHNKQQKPVLVAQHLALFDQQALPTPDLFATDYFYSSNLEKLLPKNTIFRAGGINLLDQKNKLQAYFKNRSTIYDLLFAGLLNSLKDSLQSAGSTLDLDQDFFPIFQKKYLFFASNSTTEKKPHFGLILESDSPENAVRSLSKAIIAIGPKLATQLNAKPTPMTLPDGTVGSQLTANLGAPQQLSITISGQHAQQIQFSPGFSIFLYADLNNQRVLVSNSSDTISEVLNAASAPTPIDYSLPKPTETYYLDLNQLVTAIPATAALKPLQSITIARKFTEIGLLSTYQLGF